MSKTNARNLFAVAAVAAAVMQINAETVNLAGEGWRLEGIEGTGNGEQGTGNGGQGTGNREEISMPIRVPCDVHTALFDAGKLVNPSWGDNEMKAQWPGEQDWTYSREFDLTPEFLANDSIILRLEDCDTFATIKVNDEVAGVTLIPGEPRTLVFKPRNPKTTFSDFKKSLTLKHIRETY